MKRQIRTVFIALMAFMLIAAVTIKLFDYKADRQASLLSLREVIPPSGTALFMVDSSPYARYLRSSVGIAYDGQDWNLQGIAEVQERLDRNREENGVFSPNAACLSRSYRDYNRDILNKVPVLNDPKCLELPSNTSDRVKDLSRRITEAMPTPFEKVKAIETFLQVRYEYRMDYTSPPSGWEPNDWFLFESKQGICGNFNSAFVILARASGIPARMATGYYLSPGNEGSQPVYPSQAHAWAEVGFSELGWLAFEAVPP
ncbi:MAG: transglutaminase domain-containing protein [Chloroflexi bacterium]|nr:transglutaminase domain-containing protein [Chloroflexota bacterium]